MKLAHQEKFSYFFFNVSVLLYPRHFHYTDDILMADRFKVELLKIVVLQEILELIELVLDILENLHNSLNFLEMLQQKLRVIELQLQLVLVESKLLYLFIGFLDLHVYPFFYFFIFPDVAVVFMMRVVLLELLHQSDIYLNLNQVFEHFFPIAFLFKHFLMLDVLTKIEVVIDALSFNRFYFLMESLLFVFIEQASLLVHPENGIELEDIG